MAGKLQDYGFKSVVCNCVPTGEEGHTVTVTAKIDVSADESIEPYPFARILDAQGGEIASGEMEETNVVINEHTFEISFENIMDCPANSRVTANIITPISEESGGC